MAARVERGGAVRAAIVTGGGGGIGRATAVQLAQAGFRILVVDLDEIAARETVAAVNAVGGTASSLRADVASEEQCLAYVAACEERYGGVDGFMNNAGIEGPAARIEHYPVEELDRVLRVNVRGVFLGLKAVLPAMRRRGGGSIVNVSSQAGLRGIRGYSGYSASKHAVLALAKSAALETARDGIRVNSICPGPTDTRMMDDIGEVVRAGGGDPSVFLDGIPIGRYGHPQEVAALAAWLIAEAPPFLTGATISIDGGGTAA